MGDVRIGAIVEFLTDAKSEVCVDREKTFGRRGYIAAMSMFDKAIDMLLAQQTKIESLENHLECAREENDLYREKYGEI